MKDLAPEFSLKPCSFFKQFFKQHGVQRGFCDHARWRMSLRDKDSDDDVCESSAGPGRAFPISLESLIQMKKHVITFCRISNCDARWHKFPRDNDESNDRYMWTSADELYKSYSTTNFPESLQVWCSSKRLHASVIVMHGDTYSWETRIVMYVKQCRP